MSSIVKDVTIWRTYYQKNYGTIDCRNELWAKGALAPEPKSWLWYWNYYLKESKL
jgi:hypothetical protein